MMQNLRRLALASMQTLWKFRLDRGKHTWKMEGNVLEQKSMQDLRRSWKAFILGMREMYENMRPSLEMQFDTKKASICITLTCMHACNQEAFTIYVCLFFEITIYGQRDDQIWKWLEKEEEKMASKRLLTYINSLFWLVLMWIIVLLFLFLLW